MFGLLFYQSCFDYKDTALIRCWTSSFLFSQYSYFNISATKKLGSQNPAIHLFHLFFFLELPCQVEDTRQQD